MKTRLNNTQYTTHNTECTMNINISVFVERTGIKVSKRRANKPGREEYI